MAATALLFSYGTLQRDRAWELSVHRGSIHVLPT